MDSLPAFAIAASGLAAERTQLDLIAENLANAQAQSAQNGRPYQAKFAVFESGAPLGEASGQAADWDFDVSDVSMDDEAPPAQGVRLASISQRERTPQYRFDPDNRLAAASGPHKGYVELPGVDPIEQMVSLISTGRTYDADVSVLQAAQQMETEAIDIDRY